MTVVDLDPPRAAIRAGGELDLAARQALAETLAALEAAQRWIVRLDLSEVTFLDCSCLDILVAAHHRLLDRHGTLVLTGVGARILRVLTITGLEDCLFIVPVDHDPGDGSLMAHNSSKGAFARPPHEVSANFDALMAVADQRDATQGGR